MCAADVDARLSEHLDFGMKYESGGAIGVDWARFEGRSWCAAMTDGRELTGEREDRSFGDRGLEFLLDPGAVLERANVESLGASEGRTVTARLSEPEVLAVSDPDGRRRYFSSPQRPWVQLAADVVVAGASVYEATLEPRLGLLLRWDAYCGEYLIRRIELMDVRVTVPARAGAPEADQVTLRLD